MHIRGNARTWTLLAVGLTALLSSGCLDRKLKPLNPCLVSGVVAEIAVTNIDKVDLLFMVDNSGSMREEQEALRREFPKLINSLTLGMRSDGTMFPPAKDLHLGVVSSDMGLVGIQGIPGCEDLGDDGIMNNVPDTTLAGCAGRMYPRYLSFREGVNTPMDVANDFSCLASLGTEGCGFEQQLESALKALWPSVDRDPETGQVIDPNRIMFLGDAMGFGRLGHGDVENNGFLRNDPAMGLSLIAIILVTDEEDCSSADTRHFRPSIYLEPTDPLAMQDLNLRCFYNPDNLYMLERYVNGFKALRPGAEQLVIFGAIVGVPPDLVTPEKLDAIDFADEAAREAFYQGVLDDPRMQEVPDPNRTPEQGGNLTPSCITDDGKAYPPRRIVNVARRFGQNGIIQSICQSDFGPAMDAIIDVIAKQLGAVCLPRKLVRNSDGKVGCNVVWELPKPGAAQPMTPTSCDAAPFLEAPDGDRSAVSDTGGAVCRVTQIPVLTETIQDGEGWYYDDFSTDVETECPLDQPQRVAFTTNAQPPTGVTVKLECLNEAQSLAQNRTDIDIAITQPNVGDPCDDAETPEEKAVACRVTLSDRTGGENGDGFDNTMFCHPLDNVCVISCNSDRDCPPAWVCDGDPNTVDRTKDPDARPNGSKICANPTCGGGS